MSDFVFKVKKQSTTSNMSCADAMPAKFAEERAKRDPQPGDNWTDMFSYYVHVVGRDGDKVHVREYAAPCEITPGSANKDYWCTLAEFPEKVEYVNFEGNHRWVNEAGRALEESTLAADLQRNDIKGVSMGCSVQNENCKLCNGEEKDPLLVSAALPPTGVPNANGDVFPEGFGIPKGAAVRHEDKVIGHVLTTERPPEDRVAGTVVSIETHNDNLNKCLFRDARIYLVDDSGLEQMVAHPAYAGSFIKTAVRILADGFVCRRHQRNLLVREVGKEHKNWGKVVKQHMVKGATTWNARANSVSFETDVGPANELFDGSRHLVYLVNNQLLWACKHITITGTCTEFITKQVQLQQPMFFCSSVVDNRTTKREGDNVTL